MERLAKRRRQPGGVCACVRACVHGVCDALVAACLKGDVEERPMMSVTLGDEHVGWWRQRLWLQTGRVARAGGRGGDAVHP